MALDWVLDGCLSRQYPVYHRTNGPYIALGGPIGDSPTEQRRFFDNFLSSLSATHCKREVHAEADLPVPSRFWDESVESTENYNRPPF
jgi:hypothetical protein